MTRFTSVTEGLASLNAGIESTEQNVKEALQEAFGAVSTQLNHQWRGNQEAVVFLIASQMLFRLDCEMNSITGISAHDFRLAKLMVKIWANQNGLSKGLEYI